MIDIDDLDKMFEMFDSPEFAAPKVDAIVYVNTYLNAEYPEASKVKNE